VTKTLAVVVAHPDDDTFGCSGTVALHADESGFRFVLIHVTSGEAGRIADPSLATPETLGTVREEEDRASWIALGRTPDRHEFFRYPDHRVEDQPFDELVERIAMVLQAERPDAVITFGPDGITGHPDHSATGKAATEAFHRVRERSPGEGFSRLLHQAIPRSMLDEWNRRLVAAGKDPMDPTQLYQPRGVPDEEVGVLIDCTPVVDRKLAALEEHRTQAGDMEDMQEEERRMALAAESHVIAWPERGPEDPVLTDVFQGLG
jgi:N-acetyl-1-D-myo-inositol-2-amino-2-deoxy-alpha-D-glucopyranoside deacetylase